MEYVEKRALNIQSPKWYVDESHVCIACEHLTEFYTHLNSIDQHIKFTGEPEKNGSIASLDKTTRNPDGSKMPHTDNLNTFDSTLITLDNTNPQ